MKKHVSPFEMSRQKYVISKVDLNEHREALLDLWKRNLVPCPERRYAWIYMRPPGTRSEGWLATTPSGDVIGFTGLLFRKMKIGDRQMEVGQAVDLVVDSPHRAFGPILDLQRELIRSVRLRSMPFVYAFPDRRLEKVFQRIGYQYLGETQRWTKPLRAEDWVTKYFPFPIVAKLSGRVIDVLMKWSAKERAYAKPAWGKFEEVCQFDERFDDLYRRADGRYTVLGDRSAAYLRWRVGHSGPGGCRVLALSDSRGRLHGYIAFSCQQGVTRVIDAFAEPWDCLDALLGELITRLRREKMSCINCNYMGSEWLSSLLREWGFYLRPVGAGMLVFPNDNVLTSGLLDRAQWFVTDNDRDV